jgi:hypothetical protein
VLGGNKSGELLYIKTISSRQIHIFPVFDWNAKASERQKQR